MKIKFYLPGLNANLTIKQEEQSCDFNKDLLPKSYMFYNDTSAFYRTYCEGLNNFKIREKRFLDFETPNRALITHEYDMHIGNAFDYEKFYYLFNPIERLSWLKISQEGKRLSVAGNEDAKQIVREILIGELSANFPNPDEKFEGLWKDKKGLPCFIKLENTNCNDFLLTASYYDSIKINNIDRKAKKTITFLSPLSERKIKYEYFPLEGKSSWLYIKSPNNFNVILNHKEMEFNDDNNDIDYAQSGNDEADLEKISLTIKNKKSTNTVKDTVTFSFNIIVPLSLKVWFLSIYYLSLATLFVLISYILNLIYINIFNPIWDDNPAELLIKSNDFGGYTLAIIAAIITTRSWLISEETILRRYSINITLIMVLIIVGYITILVI